MAILLITVRAQFKKMNASESQPKLRSIHHSYLQMLPTSFDPLKATDTNTQFILNHLNDNLVKWSLEDGVQPQLATSWKFANNGKEIIFRLYPGATFSDGTKITSGDVANILNRVKATPGYYKVHFSNIEKAIALNPSEIVLKLKSADPKILFLLASVPALITKMSENGKFIFSGPFDIFESNENSLTLKKRQNYYGPQPKTEYLNFQVGDDEQARKLILSSKVDDTIVLASPAIQRYFENDHWISVDMWATWAIGFDLRNKKAGNKQLRLALGATLSSKSFVDELFSAQQYAYGLIPNGMPGNLQNRVEISSTPTQMHTESFELFVPNEAQNSVAIAAWIKRQSLRSNITLQVVIKPFSEMIELLGRGIMPAFLLSFNAEYPSPYFYMNALTSSGRSNFFGVDPKALVREIGAIGDTQDNQEIAARMKKLNIYLIENAIVIPLMHVKHHAWFKDCVNGIKFNPISEGYFSLREVVNTCPQ